MPERIPQSATIRVPLQAYLSSDHVTPATGKTIAITISKNAAAYANPSAGATNAVEVANGSYYVDLSTTDTGTTGPLWVRGTEGTIDQVIAIYNVVKATNGGFSALPDAAAGANSGLPVLSSSATTLAYTVSTVSTVTNGVGLGAGAISSGSFAASAITAAAIASGALNGKGDWLLSGSYTAPDNSDIQAALTLLTGLVASGDHTQLTAHALALAPATGGGGSVTVAGYAAGQDPATLMAAAGYTTTRAGKLDNLDAQVSAIKAKTDNLPASPAAVGSAMTLTLSQTGLTVRAIDAVADASLTVGDALVAALCGAAGKEQVSGTSYLVKTPSTGTVIRTFTLDSATTPTQRS